MEINRWFCATLFVFISCCSKKDVSDEFLWGELHPFATLHIYDITFDEKGGEYVVDGGLVPVDREDLWLESSRLYGGVSLQDVGYLNLKIDDGLGFQGFEVNEISWIDTPLILDSDTVKFKIICTPGKEVKHIMEDWKGEAISGVEMSISAKFVDADLSWPIHLSF